MNGAKPLADFVALLDEKQRELRAAEQAAHAERMRRIELQEELGRRKREQTEADILRVDLVAARERIRELSQEHEQLRREVAEAEHRVAVARVERARVEREIGAAAGLEATVGPIEADRLESALSRLREAAPAPGDDSAEPARPVEPAPPVESCPAGRNWIRPAFRTMVKRDPAGAGRLAVALLPAQPIVEPLPLAYDLDLSDLGCVCVTAAGGQATVELRDLPRRREEVQLIVRGELSSLARLLAAGPLRRGLRSGLARARGSRRTLKAVRGLVRGPLNIEQLRAGGVRPNPTLALSLVAAMVAPEWTKGETFTIAHREPEIATATVCLRVRDGAPVVVGELGELGELGDGASFVIGDPDERGLARLSRPATTIVCPGASLLDVFDTASGPHLVIEGEGRPLAVLQSWVKRAQSG